MAELTGEKGRPSAEPAAGRRPPTGLRPRLSAEELERVSDGLRHELIRGELTTMAPAGFEHGVITMRLGRLVDAFVSGTGLGVVTSAETGFRIESDPDTVRAPDVGFVRRERIDAHGLPKGYFPGAPDLAAEVVSPGDAYGEVQEKVRAWLAAGTQVVWVVDPRTRTVTAHDGGTTVAVLEADGELAAPALLPGWSCRVRDLFV